MIANNYHRLRWPRALCWLLKMDAYGGLPEWWQWFIPRWGNWGGPGWSAGRWCNDPARTDWDVPADGPMDATFRDHDHDYQDGELWTDADAALIVRLHAIDEPDSLYGRLYKRGAIVVFSLHICWMNISGLYYSFEPLDKGKAK